MLRKSERMSVSAMLSGLLGGAFLLAALVHATGGAGLGELASESRMSEIAALELLSGVLLSAAAVGQYLRRLWAWKASIAGHGLGIVTSVLGLLAPQLGLGVLTAGGYVFFLVMLVLLSLSLIAMWRIRPRSPMRRAQHRMAARMY